MSNKRKKCSSSSSFVTLETHVHTKSHASLLDQQFYPQKRWKCVQYFIIENLLALEHAIQIEQHLYVQSGRDPIIYRNLCTRMAFNLQKNLQYILENFAIDEIPLLTDEQLATGTLAEKTSQLAQQKLEKVQKYLLDKEGDEKRKALIDKIGQAGASKCPKCHKDDELDSRQVQTRSIDEGMTQIYYCRRCDQQFRP